MQIDKNRDYQVGPYTYRNFITLTIEEKMMILRERNHPDVKKWMFTKEDITEEGHLAYIEGLKTRDDAYYWLMLHDGKPVGVLSIIHCDFENDEGEPGYYLFASEQEGGYGLEMQYYYKKFFFEELGLPKTLSEIGIDDFRFELMAREAVRTSGLSTRAYVKLDASDVENIYRECL